MINWLKKGTNIWALIWVILSLIIIVVNSAFRIDSYIEIAQHGHFDNFEEVNAIIFSPENSNKAILYHLFFSFRSFMGHILTNVNRLFDTADIQRHLFRMGKV